MLRSSRPLPRPAQPGQPAPGAAIAQHAGQQSEAGSAGRAAGRRHRSEARRAGSARPDVPDEAGRDVPLSTFFQTRQAGDSGAGLLPLPDAVHADPERPGEQPEGGLARPGQGFRSRRASASIPRTRRRSPPPRSRCTCGATAAPDTANGWHFLTGDEANIKALTDAVGFHYKYDPTTDQFAHASGIMILTPDGRLSRYFYGVEYAPRDLRLGLVEASQNKIGTPVDQILLFCYHYDPATGKYGAVAMNMVRFGRRGVRADLRRVSADLLRGAMRAATGTVCRRAG